MESYNIAVIKGDGIGPEIVDEAMETLERASELFGFGMAVKELPAGGAAIDRFGVPLPDDTLSAAKESDSVLLGAVGGPKWEALPGDLRPERALLGLRSGLSLFSNLRPAVLYAPLADACPLRRDIVEGGLDVLVVRELTGGIYFGERGTRKGPLGMEAYDVERYSETEVERIARVAFDMARRRRKRVTSVDKANVLESSRLWRRITERVAAEYPDVELINMFVDNAAMQLVRDPRQFDVIVTSNLFGDILSDEASMITGSIGMLPSASLGAGACGMYEPIHGSAPDIAGTGAANPIATIASAAMMLRYSFYETAAADAIDGAISRALSDGLRTADIARKGERALSTKEMGAAIRERMD